MEFASAAASLLMLFGMFHTEVKLTYPEWKYKALTFSYDDATIHDRKLVEIFNKYGMKATFNVSSKRLGYKSFLPENELAKLYAGHEIASHGEITSVLQGFLRKLWIKKSETIASAWKKLQAILFSDWPTHTALIPRKW